MQKVKNPIIITGTGRCGSTVFHRILSQHPQTAWLSRWCASHPTKPQYNRRAMRILDWPLPARYVRKLIYPTEAYRFWETHCSGFSEPTRDLLKEDVTVAKMTAVRAVMAQMLTKKRSRLLIKITGWPRIGFLKEIFPDAKFIHIFRDGRAVVNSLLNVHFWSGWRGPENWRWGELTPAQKEKWERYDRSFVVLAAIEWEVLMTAHDEAKQRIPSSDLLEIRYEELCEDAAKTVQTALDFAGLEWSPKFGDIVSGYSIKSANRKWRDDLNSEQQRMLCESLDGVLQKYGYTQGRD